MATRLPEGVSALARRRQPPPPRARSAPPFCNGPIATLSQAQRSHPLPGESRMDWEERIRNLENNTMILTERQPAAQGSQRREAASGAQLRTWTSDKWRCCAIGRSSMTFEYDVEMYLQVHEGAVRVWEAELENGLNPSIEPAAQPCGGDA